MQRKSNIDIENIMRMREIAEVYDITKQKEKSQRYHRNIILICDRHPKNEEILQLKLDSLNYLNKSFKSLETTNELLKINPYNMGALFNIAAHLRSD